MGQYHKSDIYLNQWWPRMYASSGFNLSSSFYRICSSGNDDNVQTYYLYDTV